jgi:phosphatidylserine decarboxylase
MSRTFIALQRLLPQHALSRFGGRLAASRNRRLSSFLIRNFARVYDINLSEAERQSLRDYESFNDFFTRALKPDARPLPADPLAVVSPADGAVSQAGIIERGRMLQAKGHTYSLESLLGEAAPAFDGGSFATIYLAPGDYHRVHAPVRGRLIKTRAIPGALYSVNGRTEAAIEGLFARNERLVCEFATTHGQVMVVLVGAMIVASIDTVWKGPSSPYQREEITRFDQPDQSPAFYARGAEIGRFLLGSTVIVCFERNRSRLNPDLKPGRKVRMGEAIAKLTD